MGHLMSTSNNHSIELKNAILSNLFLRLITFSPVYRKCSYPVLSRIIAKKARSAVALYNIFPVLLKDAFRKNEHFQTPIVPKRKTNQLIPTRMPLQI